MNPQKTNRDILVSTLAALDYYYQCMTVIGMTMVTYQDVIASALPFDDGDEIPIFIEVFDGSDLLPVQTVAYVALPIAELIENIKHRNKVTKKELEAHYIGDKNGPLIFDRAKWEKMTWDGLKHELYICFTNMLYNINANAYRLKFGHEQPVDHEHDFYMPDASTYKLLATDDPNFSQLLLLSKYLEDHRSFSYR